MPGHVSGVALQVPCNSCLHLLMVQEKEAKYAKASHHRKGTSIVWVGWQQEPLILIVLERPH